MQRQIAPPEAFPAPQSNAPTPKHSLVDSLSDIFSPTDSMTTAMGSSLNVGIPGDLPSLPSLPPQFWEPVVQQQPQRDTTPPIHTPQVPVPSSFLQIQTMPTQGAPTTFALTRCTNSASPAERFFCHECNKSFSRPSSLRIHTFSHTGEKPFVCPKPDCTQRFSVRSNMRRHMKVHEDPVRERATAEEYELRPRDVPDCKDATQSETQSEIIDLGHL